jgi:hypothetical protein
VPGAGAPPVVPAPPAKPARIPPAQLMYMEMHDPDCSAYCLGGNLEPHKMWFGVGVHRCAAGQFICATVVVSPLQCVVVCTCMSSICCMLVNPTAHPLHMHQAPSRYDLPCAALS